MEPVTYDSDRAPIVERRQPELVVAILESSAEPDCLRTINKISILVEGLLSRRRMRDDRALGIPFVDWRLTDEVQTQVPGLHGTIAALALRYAAAIRVPDWYYTKCASRRVHENHGPLVGALLVSTSPPLGARFIPLNIEGDIDTTGASTYPPTAA
jgi:hypothetical protein